MNFSTRRGRAITMSLLAACAFACDGDPAQLPGHAEITALRKIAQPLGLPFDAAPDPTGARIVFSLVRPTGDGALMLTSRRGEEPKVLAEGFTLPMGVVFSLDGAFVFVADSGADDHGRDAVVEIRRGLISMVAIEDGTKTPLEQTRGYAPRGLDVARVDGQDWLYFTGTDPSDGKVGVFRMGPDGRALVVHKGTPLADPSSLAVNRQGDVFVTDLGGPVGGDAVIHLSRGSASYLTRELTFSAPAGIALSESERFLLVSALQPGGTAAVQRLEISSSKLQAFDEGLAKTYDAAGLHRAHQADTFVWSSAGGASGTVYVVGTKKVPLE